MSARANQVTQAYLAECATPDSRLRGALADFRALGAEDFLSRYGG